MSIEQDMLELIKNQNSISDKLLNIANNQQKQLDLLMQYISHLERRVRRLEEPLK